MTKAMTKTDLEIISARERAAFRDADARQNTPRTSERIDQLANLRTRCANIGAEIRGLLETQRERLMEYKQMLFNIRVVGKLNAPMDETQLGERLEKHQKKIDTLEKHLRVVDFVVECLIMGMRAEYLKLKKSEGNAKTRAEATVALVKLRPTIKAFNTQIRAMMAEAGAKKKSTRSKDNLSASEIVGIAEEELLVLGFDDLMSRYQVSIEKEKSRSRNDEKPLFTEGRRMEKEGIRHIYAAGSVGGPPPLPKPIVHGAVATVSRSVRAAAPRYQQPRAKPGATQQAVSGKEKPRQESEMREQFGAVFDEMIEEFANRRRR